MAKLVSIGFLDSTLSGMYTLVMAHNFAVDTIVNFLSNRSQLDPETSKKLMPLELREKKRFSLLIEIFFKANSVSS